MTAPSVTEGISRNLVELGMPGSLEALPGILQRLDGAALSPGEAIRELLAVELALRMDRRLQALDLTLAQGGLEGEVEGVHGFQRRQVRGLQTGLQTSVHS
jgi:hypothetical protein